MTETQNVEQAERIGNWLAREDAQQLLDAPDTETLKGKRDPVGKGY